MCLVAEVSRENVCKGAAYLRNAERGRRKTHTAETPDIQVAHGV